MMEAGHDGGLLGDTKGQIGHMWEGRQSGVGAPGFIQPYSLPCLNFDLALPPAEGPAVSTHLSARSSRGEVPWSQLLTIHAVSKAARKPRAQPVPMGQNGYKGHITKFQLIPAIPSLTSHSIQHLVFARPVGGTGRTET